MPSCCKTSGRARLLDRDLILRRYVKFAPVRSEAKNGCVAFSDLLALRERFDIFLL